MKLKKRPRILLYSHDTYGLGHLRRNLAIATQVAADIPKSHQLLMTGSTVAGAFPVPPRFDAIKLPALSKRSSGEYKARTLPLTLKRTIAWREQMLLQAAINFEPDIVLVDKSAAGVHGELLPTLRHLKTWSPETKLVLGMRDIEDSPAKTIGEWERGGVYALLDDVYDRILLYGERSVFDPVAAYQLSDKAAAKVVETGYLGRAIPQIDTQRVRRELEVDDRPFIVVTVGGGGDGYEILNTYLNMARRWGGAAPYHTLLVTGPLMAERKRQQLAATVRGRNITLMTFTPRLLDYMASADLVVSMAGYNTTVELLSLGQRAVLIPRAQVRAEQRIRAERLDARGLATHLPLDQLTPDTLAHAVKSTLAAPRPFVPLNLNGLPCVTATLQQLLQPKPKTTPRELRAAVAQHVF